jgi:hypothetical protein
MTGLIALHVALSAWMVIQFDGVYTKGRPAPTEIHALVAVDKNHSLYDVEFENDTKYLFYILDRDSNATIGNSANNSSGDSETDSNGSGVGSNKPKGDEGNDGQSFFTLDGTRATILTLLFVLIYCEALLLVRMKNIAWLRGFVWFALIACFILVLPLTYLGSLDGETSTVSGDGGGKAMVHKSSDTDIDIVPLGLVINYNYSGYDLGLVAPENRSAVIDSPPVAGSEDAKSWIAFESTFSIATGKNVLSLLFLPFVWFFIPANPAKSTDDETGEETAKDYSIGDEESE